MALRNKQVAAIFREIADLIEILEEGAKAAAYRRAAFSLEGLREDVAELRRQGRLTDIPGVGTRLALKIEEILDTGTCAARERLLAQVPPGVLDLLAVPGVGPRTAGALFRHLGVAGLEDMERAARSGRLAGVPGLGEKKARAIREGLVQLRAGGQRHLLGSLLPLAEDVSAAVAALPGVVRVEVAGSLRRRCETIGDIDLVVAADHPGAVAGLLAELAGVVRVLAAGEERVSVLLGGNLQVDFLLVEPPSLAAAMVHFTGSAAHNVRLRERAHRYGFRLNERGLFPLGEGTGAPVFPASEEELYERVGLPWIPPELREDTGEIEAADAGRLPVLVTAQDIRGDLHVHTKWSDGADTLEQMAEAARARGYAYIAVSDHSRSLAVAHGLSLERLREQGRLIADLNRRMAPFRLLRSAEVDILKDGTLDFPDEVLAELDIVTASVHTAFRLGREAMTRRVIAAIRNPHVDVIGHLTGRLIGRRQGYEVDLDAILEAAREAGTALELNASPDRLDLCDRDARRAREMGVRVAVSTDAHAVPALDDMRYGISTARRGWLGPADVLNTLPVDDLLAALSGRARCIIY